LIEMDLANRRLTLKVPDEEIARRLAQWQPRPPAVTSGLLGLYGRSVQQANHGAVLR
jgi:dihydroxyacid dehydratase/phosphogluconate dehydratase